MDRKAAIRKFIEENMVIYDEGIVFSDSDNIFEQGFVDSMFALKLVTFIENEYGLMVQNEDLNLQNFSSVNNINNFIERKLAA